MTYRIKKNKKHRKKRYYGKRTAAVGFFPVVIVVLVFLLNFATLLIKGAIKDAYAGEQTETIFEPIEEAEAAQEEPEDLQQDAANAGSTEEITYNTEEITYTVKDPVFVLLPVDMPEEEQRIVFKIATENNISYSFVMAVIGHESEFTRTARSQTGDTGYMQINDCNVEEMAKRGFTDLYDTEDNIGAGVSILRDLFNTYGEDEVHKVLMAYNMGAGRASELWAQGVTESEYSKEIVSREREYSAYIDDVLMNE